VVARHGSTQRAVAETATLEPHLSGVAAVVDQFRGEVLGS
jgi:hypothetical protein